MCLGKCKCIRVPEHAPRALATIAIYYFDHNLGCRHPIGIILFALETSEYLLSYPKVSEYLDNYSRRYKALNSRMFNPNPH